MLEASDGRGGRGLQRYTLHVDAVQPNRPPVFTSVPPVSANVGSEYVYQAATEDADGDTVTYSLVNPLEDMAIVPTGVNAGRVTWTPKAGQVGAQSVTVHAVDGNGGIVEQLFTIETTPKKNPLEPSAPAGGGPLVSGTG